MQIMKKSGIVIYLKMHPNSILKRLKTAKNPRPLLRNIPEDQLLPFITNQLSQRERFYLNAHFTVKGESLDIDEVVKTVKGLRS
jgi:shikimate kinase